MKARRTHRRSCTIATILTACSTVAFAVDGVPDPTFGGGDGFSNFEFFPASPKAELGYGVAASPGGKLVVVGSLEWSVSDLDFGIARLLPDGSLDAGYGVLGTQTAFFDPLPSTSLDIARGVAVDSLGRAWVVGSTTLAPGGGGLDLAFVRLTPEGAVESGSHWTVDSGGTTDSVGEDILLASDSRAFIAGRWGDVPSLFRLDEDGSSIQGSVYLPLGYSSGALNAIAMQPDGKLLAAGWALYGSAPFDADLLVIRVDQNLQLDTSFGFNGKVTFNSSHLNYGEYGSDVAALPDGRIVAGLTTVNTGVSAFASLLALTSSGAPSPAFDHNFPSAFLLDALGGMGTLGAQASPSLAPLSDGTLLVGASVAPSGNELWRFRRLRPRIVSPQFLETDPTFGNAGNSDVASFGLQGLALEAGRTVAVGFYPDVTDDFAVVRLTASLIFRDGFESTSTFQWSAVTP